MHQCHGLKQVQAYWGSHPGFLISLIGMGNYPQDPSGYGPTRPSQTYGQAEQGYSAAGRCCIDFDCLASTKMSSLCRM